MYKILIIILSLSTMYICNSAELALRVLSEQLSLLDKEINNSENEDKDFNIWKEGWLKAIEEAEARLKEHSKKRMLKLHPFTTKNKLMKEIKRYTELYTKAKEGTREKADNLDNKYNLNAQLKEVETEEYYILTAENDIKMYQEKLKSPREAYQREKASKKNNS